MSDTWILMDARAGLIGPSDAAVLMTGSCEQCCDAANSDEYGFNAVVIDPGTGEPAWALMATGVWAPEVKP